MIGFQKHVLLLTHIYCCSTYIIKYNNLHPKMYCIVWIIVWRLLGEYVVG